MKKIIIVRGVEDTGKTTTIQKIIAWLENNYTINKTFQENEHGDTRAVFEIGNFTIGFNSSGDNLLEVAKIEKLKTNRGTYADIIICASRTRGETQKFFKENFSYNQNWLKIYQNVRRVDPMEERAKRDTRIFEEIKTRLIGIEKMIND